MTLPDYVYCVRCEKHLNTIELLVGSINITFESPLMPYPSPPATVCHECGLGVTDYLGIKRPSADREKTA